MTDSSAELNVIRAVYAALAAGEADRLVSLTDPAVEIDQSALLPYGGHHQGYSGLKDFLAGVGRTLDSKVEIGELFVAGDRIVQIGRTRGVVRATGKPFDAPEVHLWRVRDGRIVSLDVYVDTTILGNALMVE